MNKKKFHYGWVVVVACMMLNAIGTGIFSSILGMFFPALVEEFAYSQAEVAGIISIAILAGLLTIGVFSKLYQKYSTRNLILVFGVLNALSYMAMSQAKSLIVMYMIASVIGIFGMGATALSSPMLITKWFNDKRGTAMGIAVSGAGLGPAIMAPVITTVIESSGYKLGFITLGSFVLVMTLISFILIKNNPEDIGLKAYIENRKKSSKDNSADKSLEQYNYTLKEAVKTKMFYGFMLFIIVICSVVQGVLVQIPSYLNEIGFTGKDIGMIVATYAFIAAFGKMIIGFTYDKVGVYKGNYVFFTLMISAFVALKFAASIRASIYVYVLCAGLGLGLTPVAVPLIVSILFGSKHYSALYPIFMLMMSVGAISGGIIAGILIDKVGYSALMVFAIAGASIAFLLIQSTMKISNKTQKKYIKEVA